MRARMRVGSHRSTIFGLFWLLVYSGNFHSHGCGIGMDIGASLCWA